MKSGRLQLFDPAVVQVPVQAAAIPSREELENEFTTELLKTLESWSILGDFVEFAATTRFGDVNIEVVVETCGPNNRPSEIIATARPQWEVPTYNKTYPAGKFECDCGNECDSGETGTRICLCFKYQVTRHDLIHSWMFRDGEGVHGGLIAAWIARALAEMATTEGKHLTAARIDC